jgi:hypothetical protein
MVAAATAGIVVKARVRPALPYERTYARIHKEDGW